MSIRNFKQLFSIVFALILASLFLSVGLNLKSLLPEHPQNVVLQTFLDMMSSSAYRNSFAGALGVIGFLLGAVAGPITAQSLVHAGNAIERMSAKDKIAIAFGTFIGAAVSLPLCIPLSRVPLLGIPLGILLAVACIYLGIRATWGMKDEFRFIGAPASVPESEEDEMERCKILDTNVIIDGRIQDIVRTGFIEGAIYVPGFVLDELQHIADSSDSLKRARGRRGLDILNAMQEKFPLIVRTHDHRLGNERVPDEVDTKLVKLAKAMNGCIVTNDFNLNKVAALQGVQVLNVNELANALKPVVLPGEEMPVTIIKEGKEQNQGVAYLDDGTMIVVEDGRRRIGENLDVVVTSVLQTVAGKMIFARIKGTEGETDDAHDYSRSRTSSGPRHKVR